MSEFSRDEIMTHPLEKLETLSELVKDVHLIAAYEEKPEELLNYVFKLTSEAARLAVLKKYIEKLFEAKNDYLKAYLQQEKKIDELQDEFDKFHEQNKQFIKQVESARLVAHGVTVQMIAMANVLKEGKFSEQVIRELVNNTKTYGVRCPKCKIERFSQDPGELIENSLCKKCNEVMEFLTIYGFNH